MQLKLSVPSDRKEELLSLLDTHDAKVDSTEQTASNVSVVVQVEPGVFRELNAAMQGLKGRLEVLTFAVTADGAATELSMAAAAAASAAGPAGLRPPLAGASTPAPSAQQDAADVADAAAAAAAVAASTTRREAGPMVGEVVYVRGSIARLPEAHASRRERFSELDTLQPGWQVELRTKGDTVEAVFYSPSGQLVGSYAAARRMALQASKQQQSTAV